MIANILHAASVAKRCYQSALKPYKISYEEWMVLSCLKGGDNITQKEIAEKLGKDNSQITRLLDKLEQLGFAKRRPSPGDRRAFLVSLQPEKSELLQEIAAALDAESKKLLSGLQDYERDMLSALLGKIINI